MPMLPRLSLPIQRASPERSRPTAPACYFWFKRRCPYCPAAARYFSLPAAAAESRSEEHTSELQSLTNLVCRLLLEKKKKVWFNCVHNREWTPQAVERCFVVTSHYPV